MKKDNEEKLRNEAIRIFSNHFNVSPDDAGLSSVTIAQFGLVNKQTFAIFAEDEETAKAYIKHQGFMHVFFEVILFFLVFVAIFVIFAFWQIIKENIIPVVVLGATAGIAAIIIFALYFCWLKPLDKKIHDKEGNIQVITFYHKKKGGWYKGVCAPEFLAKHISLDED